MSLLEARKHPKPETEAVDDWPGSRQGMDPKTIFAWSPRGQEGFWNSLGQPISARSMPQKSLVRECWEHMHLGEGLAEEMIYIWRGSTLELSCSKRHLQLQIGDLCPFLTLGSQSMIWWSDLFQSNFPPTEKCLRDGHLADPLRRPFWCAWRRCEP